MIKGIVFRGIGYKCAMLYYNNSEWLRAIKEFESIVSSNDPYIYEMMSKCHFKLGNNVKYLEYMNLAINSYIMCEQIEKSEQLKSKLLLTA